MLRDLDKGLTQLRRRNPLNRSVRILERTRRSADRLMDGRDAGHIPPEVSLAMVLMAGTRDCVIADSFGRAGAFAFAPDQPLQAHGAVVSARGSG